MLATKKATCILTASHEEPHVVVVRDVPPSPRNKRPEWLRWLTIAFVIALFAYVVRNIVQDAGNVEWSGLIRRPENIAAAMGLWAFVFLFRAWLWGEMMRRAGYPVGHIAATRVFLASHLGRFLPGKLWSVLGAGVFGKQLGVPASACAVTMMVFLIMYYMMGSLFVLLVIGQVSQTHIWAAIAIGILGIGTLVFLGTKWFPMVLRWVGRKANRNLDDVSLPAPFVLVLVALGLGLVWAGAGTAFGLMIGGILSDDAPKVGLLHVIGSYASALVAGFAVLFAPAGLGVREAVMTVLIKPLYGGALAGVIAIVARVLMTSLELLLSLWGIWPHLKARRQAKAIRVSAQAEVERA